MLITGISGLLGNNLACYFRDKYEVSGTYNTHDVTIEGVYTHKCDLSNPDDIRNQISGDKKDKPDIIIHCASLTNIEDCEVTKEYTKKINVGATRIISEAADKHDIKLIYISSDSVYDGVKGNFSENDNINPQNYYGLSKYLGELEVLKVPDSLVLRTNIFGWNIQEKASLGEWILQSLQKRKTIKGFKDAIFSSIYTFELARVIDIAIKNNLSGTFNCGASYGCSRYEFALKIAELFGLDKSLIIPISIDDYDFKARRGKNLSLNVNGIQEALNYRLTSIEGSVDSFYRDFKSGLPDEIRKADTERTDKQPAFIQYGKQWIDSNDIRAVVNILKDGPITQGPKVQEFENALSNYCSAKYAVACNSGTSGLHIACLAAGISPADEVITSPNTFVASANCILYCGARPVFADIDPLTYNIAPGEIEKKITKHTKAVIPVHFAGQSCDMGAIKDIVTAAEKKYGHKIYLIEDACHALGSSYKGCKVGSCTYSDMTVMSFHPVKHITTGEGGIVLTNDKKLSSRLRQLRSHGITSDPEAFMNKDLAYQDRSMDNPSPNPWYYEQISLGFNYRLTDIQCALGLSQLKKLNIFQKRRREIVNIYNRLFSSVNYVQTPFEDEKGDSNFHLYVLLFDFEKIKKTRAQLMFELRAKDIQTQVHYIPVHLQSYYRQLLGTNWGDCPQTEGYYQKCLSLPLHPTMADQDINRVIREVKKAL